MKQKHNIICNIRKTHTETKWRYEVAENYTNKQKNTKTKNSQNSTQNPIVVFEATTSR